MQEGAGNREQHAQFASEDCAARRCRRAQPLQRKDKKRGGDQVGDFDDVFHAGQVGHGFFGPLALNIRSMRSVIRNPPTMLLVAATIAIVPRIFASIAPCAWYSPARMMAPTTAMASSALVKDIKGVCSRGETRRMTSNPINAASMKT